MQTLTAIERRVLGSLIEKSLATPQNYPLSLNALANACNQKSARDPVTEYTDDEVLAACRALQPRNLAIEFFAAGSRVSKWEEAMVAVLELEDTDAAVLAELLLRGPQSTGELRQRASRMADIPSLEALDAILKRLSERDEPLVVCLDPGRSRGVRWAHTLYPEDEQPDVSAHAATSTRVSSRTPTPELLDRLEALEARVKRLEAELGMAVESDDSPTPPTTES